MKRNKSGQAKSRSTSTLALKPEKEAHKGKPLWADRTNGMLAGAFRKEDYERQDLLGALLRKHLPEEQRKK
jgi:hypothetical protein